VACVATQTEQILTDATRNPGRYGLRVALFIPSESLAKRIGQPKKKNPAARPCASRGTPRRAVKPAPGAWNPCLAGMDLDSAVSDIVSPAQPKALFRA
jgi:hypothetical protein